MFNVNHCLNTHIYNQELSKRERIYVAGHSVFFDRLPRELQRRYGSSAGTPKVINTLEYSRCFARFGTISFADTGACGTCCVSGRET